MHRALLSGLALAALAGSAVAADGFVGAPQVDSVEAWLARPDARPVVPPGPLLTPLDGGWDVRVTAWLAAPKANIDAEFGGVSGHVDADFGDALIGGLRFEMVGGTFGILAEIEGTAVESDDVPGDYTYGEAHADLGIVFRVIGVNEGRALKLDLFGGGRYRTTAQEVASLDDDDAWWEPFAGADVRVPFLIGDIVARVTLSGFSVGPTTMDLTATAGIEFLVGPVFVTVGLRYQDTHFSSSTGGGYEIDIQSVGPYVAAGVDF